MATSATFRLPSKKQLQKILDYCLKKWVQVQSPIDALDIGRKFKYSDEKAIAVFNEFAKLDYGITKEHIGNYLHLDPNLKEPITFEEKPTASFFPSENLVKKWFWANRMCFQNRGEYAIRQLFGADLYSLIYFSDDALQKYYANPNYEVDTEDFIHYIRTKDTDEEVNYVYLRFGHRQLENGRTAICLFLKDLAESSYKEQSYWHSFELEYPKFINENEDLKFIQFCRINIGGVWEDYPNSLNNYKESLMKLNACFNNKLFKACNLDLLVSPSSNNKKQFYLACQDLVKPFDNENLKKQTLKNWIAANKLREKISIENESGKECLPREILKRLENYLMGNNQFSNCLKPLSDYRNEIAHKMDIKEIETNNYNLKFLDLVKDLSIAINNFANAISNYQSN